MPEFMPVMPDDVDLEQRLCDRVWEFTRADGTVIAPAVRFERRGRILGHINANELRWCVHDGHLEFVSAHGTTTTRFGSVSRRADGRLELRGPFLGNPTGIVNILSEVAEASRIIGRSFTARRNLVVMRAGNNALLPSWVRATSRNWDLAVSFYGDGQPDWGQEYFIAEKGPKWQPIHRWLSANPDLLRQYDWFWFPDDDILTTWENANEFFNICRDFDLQLSQPALTRDSYFSHEVTRQQPDYLLRFTVFVEVMVPAFRTDALRLCLPIMQEETRFGWGHDWVFPMLLGYPLNKIAIVDACAVKHTRPAGINTDCAAANREMKTIADKYGAKFMDHRVRGCIFREPEPGGFWT
jgi:hypothetical protein